MQNQQTQQTSPREKAKRIRLTVKDISLLPRDYQLRVMGAVDLAKLLHDKQTA